MKLAMNNEVHFLNKYCMKYNTGVTPLALMCTKTETVLSHSLFHVPENPLNYAGELDQTLKCKAFLE